MSMDKQLSLSALSDELSQVRTKKREFLAEIDRIVPWEKWISIIKPYYYKGERGNKPYDLERMLRIYLVQNLYNLSDMAAGAEGIDSLYSMNQSAFLIHADMGFVAKMPGIALLC